MARDAKSRTRPQRYKAHAVQTAKGSSNQRAIWRYLTDTGYFNCTRTAVFHPGQAASSAFHAPHKFCCLPAECHRSCSALGAPAACPGHRSPRPRAPRAGSAQAAAPPRRAAISSLPQHRASPSPGRSGCCSSSVPLGPPPPPRQRGSGGRRALRGPRSLFFAGTAASTQESPLRPSLPTHAPRPLRGSPAAIIAGDPSCRDSLPLPSGGAGRVVAAGPGRAQVPRGPARRRRAAGGGGRGRSRGDLAS